MASRHPDMLCILSIIFVPDRTEGLTLNGLRKSDDGVQGRAHLVREIGEHHRAVRGLGPGAIDFLHQPARIALFRGAVDDQRRRAPVGSPFDDDLEPVGVERIEDVAFQPDFPAFPVAGFEDCRLFQRNGEWWASATARDRSSEGICQIVLLRLDGAAVTAVHTLSDGVTRHEKNWMPVVSDDRPLRFVYSVWPTVLLAHDDDLAATRIERENPAAPIAERFSGGSQVIAVDEGWLCLIHESVIFDDGGRVYTHRWVWFDAEWRLAPMLAAEHHVDVETDPSQALFHAADGNYDLLIVSLSLDNFDGLRLCSQARSLERTRQVPILAISDADNNTRLLRGLEIGVNDYLLRPVDKNELLAIMSVEEKYAWDKDEAAQKAKGRNC